jgi:alpha-L-rhamnosidase/Glycosyl hydrolases family 2, sugar binding domain
MKRTDYTGPKRHYRVTRVVGAFCLIMVFSQCVLAQQRTNLSTQFQMPPNSAKPYAYWWWLNGHTDKATITSDLGAMQKEGYGGAILMDANGSDQGGNSVVTPGPTFASPAWQELLLHTLKEAKRLNLKISLTIQSGWNVGGPSVTPAQSAKLLTWSRQAVRGPKNVSLKLAQPPSENGFYQDIAVLAYPLKHGSGLAGDPTTGSKRQPIRYLKTKALFNEAGGSTPDSKPLLADFPATAGEADCLASEVVDVTSHMTPQGALEWKVPEGEWEILRLGYTSSNARVSTGSGAWQGLVIDYLDRDALTSYWNTNIQPMLDAAKPYLGVSLTNVYTDSWEVGGVNWTGRFREAFRADRGYDLLPYLPVVTGRIVTDRQTSDRFLNDFRRTVGDLVLNEHYRVFAKLAAKNGLGIHPESGGPHGAPVDALRVLGASRFPQTEFWAPSKVHRTKDIDRFFIKEASSAAHIYGKTLVAGEGMTSIGPQWEESPGMDLKPAFDQAVCEGLNFLVWHTFTSSPKDTGLPGQEYFAGTHFNPKVTWFEDGKAFIDYIRRVQFMMQQGVPVSDVLYYYGDQVPNFVQTKGADPAHVLPHYDYDVVNEDVLTTGLSVRDHRLHLANGTEYRELVLPPLQNISLPALKAIDRLVTDGATVVGTKPIRLTGLPHGEVGDEEITKLADRLWSGCSQDSTGTSTVGTGKIVCDGTALDGLKLDGVSADFSADEAKGDEFDFVHRRMGETDIYFVRNTTPAALAAVLSFRVHGRAPEIWNAESGKVTASGIYAETADGHTSVPAWFAPYESIIMVFDKAVGAHIVRLERDGHKIFPKMDAGSTPISVEMRDSLPMLQTDEDGRYLAIDAKGRSYHATLGDASISEINTPWKLAFTPGWGAPAEVSIDRLASWTKSSDDNIRHYSGTASYSSLFHLQASCTSKNARVQLDLGEVRETARVWVNGREVGVLWKAPFSLDITPEVMAGANTLRVDVTNLWPNRLIGDQSLPADKRFTHTNITKFASGTPLLPSGLLGPVLLRTSQFILMTPN